jgi:uncharacterized membrane protein YphA (DoxX/SURF4 family)
MALETVSPVAFLLARILFGGVLAFMGLNHFMQTDEMAGYAEAKGAPVPRLSVLGSGLLLVLGGLGIVVGAFPVVTAGVLAAFLLVITPIMHDFWAVDEEQQQQEMTNFLKNVALAGAALAFLAVGGAEWPLAVTL